MPSIKNPGALTAGQGALPAKSVEDVSLKNPDRDIQSLLGHTLDPRKAHMASAIAIVDAGGFYSSDQVEGALQEIAGGGSAGRENGVVSGGTYGAAGLNVTLAADTSVLLNGVLSIAYASASITLPIAAGTYYLYVHGSTGVLTASLVLPLLSTEPILFAEITHNGVGITSSRDARFFVTNLDRKVDYTVRSDSAANNSSEACFVSLEAAFFWLEKYGSGAEKKNTVIVRGNHNLTDTITVSVSNVTVRGEGAASITFGPTADFHVFDLGSTTDFTLENIEFICNSGTDLAIPIYSAGTSDNLTVRNCKFSSGTKDWLSVVSCAIDGQSILEGCTATTSSAGIALVLDGGSLVLKDLVLTGSAAAISSSSGIQLQPDNTQDISTVISGCVITNFYTGINDMSAGGLGFVKGFTVENCTITDVVNGITSSSGTSYIRVLDSTITTDATVGLYGAFISGGQALVSGCSFVSPRDPTTYLNTEIPAAVRVSGDDIKVLGCYAENFVNTAGRGAAVLSTSNSLVVEGCNFFNSQILVFDLAIAKRTRVTIADNTMYGDGFVALSRSLIEVYGTEEVSITGNVLDCNTSGATTVGYNGGIEISGGSQTIFGGALTTGVSRNVVVSGNTVKASISSGIRIGTSVTGYVISGNSVDGYLSGDTFSPTSYGIRVASTGISAKDGRITGNRITRCRYGVIVEGSSSNPVLNLGVDNNTISFCARNFALADTFFGRGACGVAAEFCEGLSITSNTLRNIGEIIDDAGVYGFPTGADEKSSTGVLVWNSLNVNISQNTVSNSVSSDGGEIRGFVYEVLSPTVTTTVDSVSIEGNHFDFSSMGRGTNNGISGCEVFVEGDFTNNWTQTLQNLNVSNNQVFSVLRAWVSVDDNALVAPGDTVTINGTALTAVAGAPGVNEFQIGGNAVATAENIRDAINNTSNSFTALCSAIVDTTTGYQVDLKSYYFPMTVATVSAGMSDSGARFESYLERGIDIQVGDYARLENSVLNGNTVTNFSYSGLSARMVDNRSFIEGLSITGNSVKGGSYTTNADDSAGILLDNASPSGVSVLRSVVVSGNTVSDVGSNGILAKSLISATALLRDIEINGNDIGSVFQGPGGPRSYGIRVCSDSSSLGGVTVSGNFVNQNHNSSPTPAVTPLVGVGVGFFGVTNSSDLFDVNISGNTMYTSDFGVFVFATTFAVNSFTNIKVEGNTLRVYDPGTLYKGIWIKGLNHDLTKCLVANNMIRAETTAGRGIELIMGLSSESISILNNQCTFHEEGIHLELSVTQKFLHVDGNILYATAAAADQYAIYADVGSGTGGVYDSSISGNTCADVDHAINVVAQADISGLTINKNVIRDCSTHGVFVDCVGDADDLTILENVVSGTSTGVYLNMAVGCTRTTVSNNTISDADTYGVIAILADGASLLKVDENTIQGTTTNAVSVSSGSNLSGISVSKNAVYSSKSGIYVQSDTLVTSSVIDENTIYGFGATNSTKAIHVSAFLAELLSVSRNVVQCVDPGVGTYTALDGILVDVTRTTLNAVVTDAPDIHSINVDDNSVSGDFDDGIDNFRVITLLVSDPASGLSVSRNNIVMAPTAPYTVRGICLAMSDGTVAGDVTWENCHVDQNRVHANTLASGGTYPHKGALIVDLDSTRNVQMLNFSLCGNTLARHAAAAASSGLYVTNSAAITSNAWRVSNNSSIGFADPGAGTEFCAEFVFGATPTNSVFMGNISQDAGEGGTGFAGPVVSIGGAPYNHNY